MYLIDTCVLSEARRRSKEAVAWLSAVDPNLVFVSVMTIGEIMKGVPLWWRADPLGALSLTRWLEELRTVYADRVLPIDDAVAMTWGRLMARRTLPVVDGLIAATARVHEKVLVTRNVADFDDAGVEIVNAWAG
jgi:predicted nucleic acid-binding protein